MLNSGLKTASWQTPTSVKWTKKASPKIPVPTVLAQMCFLTDWNHRRLQAFKWFFPLRLFFIPEAEKKPQSWGFRSRISASFSGLPLRTQCMAAVLPANQNPLLHLYLLDMPHSGCMLLQSQGEKKKKKKRTSETLVQRTDSRGVGVTEEVSLGHVLHSNLPISSTRGCADLEPLGAKRLVSMCSPSKCCPAVSLGTRIVKRPVMNTQTLSLLNELKMNERMQGTIIPFLMHMDNNFNM